jgi:hypothetical protein
MAFERITVDLGQIHAPFAVRPRERASRMREGGLVTIERRRRLTGELRDAVEEAKAIRLMVPDTLDRIDGLLLDLTRDRLLDERRTTSRPTEGTIRLLTALYQSSTTSASPSRPRVEVTDEPCG